MNTNGLKATVQAAIIVAFLVVCAGFLLNLWGAYVTPPPNPPTPFAFTNVTTVRLPLAELIRLEEDTSGADCYACHEEGVVKDLAFDENGMVVLPKAHRDLIYYRMNCAACHNPEEEVEVEYDDDLNVIIPAAHTNAVLRHGTHSRNNNCYNCHVPDKLTLLRTRSGQDYPLTESTQVCGGCHGTTLRDWEAGIHGRWNGFWLDMAGERTREGCAACHDPHAPGFPSMNPGRPPAPYAQLEATRPQHEATEEDDAHTDE